MNITWPQLSLFLRTLEEQGFALLPERYDLVLQIAQRCENTEELGSKLRALLSSSPQQQRQFGEWFEQFFNPGSGTTNQILAEDNPENKPIQGQRIQEILDQELAAQIAARKAGSKTTKPNSFTLLEIITLVILFLTAVALQISALQERVLWKWVLVLSLYTFLVLFLLRRLLKRPARPFTLKREKLDTPPGGLFDIHIPPHREIRFGRSFQGIARSLRQRLPTDQPVLDAAATVRSSIRQGGFLTPQYSYRSKTPAYLMLINQTSAANHRFHLAEELYKWMQKQDIEVDRFWFRNDPRSCWNEAHPTGIPLEQLAQRYPESRLLLFGDGWQLLNPVTQKLATWAQTFTQWDTRNLITPIVPKAWTTKEKNLAQLFVLAPASVEGLRYWSYTYASHMDNGASKAPEWREKPVIITTQNFEGALQHHFPDVHLREWLCALACFPKLNWELTLYIGSWLSINRGVYLLHYDNLRLLTRLSWFHNGFIPEEMRKLLYAQLDEGIKPKVHQWIVELLDKQLKDGKSHFSLSRREMELQIVVQQVAAGTAKASELKRYLESTSDQGQVSDFLVLDILKDAHDPFLPERLLEELLQTASQQLQKIRRKSASTPSNDAVEAVEQEKNKEIPHKASPPFEAPIELDPADFTREIIHAPQMIRVAGGSFALGEKHTISLDDFEISQTAVTFAMYDSFCRATGRDLPRDEGWGRDNRPIINVDWYDTIEYCNWLSTTSGKQPVYAIDKDNKDPHNTNEKDEKKWIVSPNWNANGYRLPTEAEWEYAAHGGQQSKGYKYAGSNNLDEVGWYWENSGDKKLSGKWDYDKITKNNCRTHPVAEKKPNELGLYDLSGNVWEWCWDWYLSYDKSAPAQNPHGGLEGNTRVVRGGSWYDYDFVCQVSIRVSYSPDYRVINIGFRVVCRRLTL